MWVLARQLLKGLLCTSTGTGSRARCHVRWRRRRRASDAGALLTGQLLDGDRRGWRRRERALELHRPPPAVVVERVRANDHASEKSMSLGFCKWGWRRCGSGRRPPCHCVPDEVGGGVGGQCAHLGGLRKAKSATCMEFCEISGGWG
jgi:hypothetical protein